MYLLLLSQLLDNGSRQGLMLLGFSRISMGPHLLQPAENSGGRCNYERVTCTWDVSDHGPRRGTEEQLEACADVTASQSQVGLPTPDFQLTYHGAVLQHGLGYKGVTFLLLRPLHANQR